MPRACHCKSGEGDLKSGRKVEEDEEDEEDTQSKVDPGKIALGESHRVARNEIILSLKGSRSKNSCRHRRADEKRVKRSCDKGKETS